MYPHFKAPVFVAVYGILELVLGVTGTQAGVAHFAHLGGLVGGNLWLEGYFARMMYISLYKLHQLALHGFVKVALDTLARLITRRTEPHVKLH